MEKDNEYVQAVIKHLSRNNELQAHLKILEADKTAKEDMLKTIKYQITTKYSETVCFSTGTGSKVEKTIEQRDKLKNELADINLSCIDIKNNLGRITNALNQLDDISQTIIKCRLIEHDTWENISCNVHYGIKTCRRKHDKALQSIAVSMFGMKAISNN